MNLPISSRLLLLVAGLVVAPLFAADGNRDIPLQQLVGAGRTISDAEYGVSLTYPAGWTAVRAFRWGADFDKTTLVIQPPQSGARGVSIFYQRFGRETQRPAEIKDWFRSLFQEKEATKQSELPGYKNDPRSLKFGTTATGLPTCSYLARFTRDGRRLAEYYLRVAGEKTYVMVLTQGPVADVEALREEIERMANSVRLP
jgi:hypothetical protein